MFVSALLAIGILLGSATAGLADDSKPVDPGSIPDVRKPEVAAQIRDKTAHDYCIGEEAISILPWDVLKDVDPSSEKFKKCYNWALAALPTGFDQLVPYTTIEGRLAACKEGGPFYYTNKATTDFSKREGYATQFCGKAQADKQDSDRDKAWRSFWAGIIGGGGVAFVDFVANPKNSFEDGSNGLKKDSIAALTQVINDASRATDFDPNEPWFRAQWAAFSGIGILVLGFMVTWTMRDFGEQKITGEEATHALVGFGPLGLLLVLFGPVIGGFLNSKVAALDQGIIKFTAGSALNFAKATDFNGLQSGGVFGPFAGVIVWGLLLIGAWSVLLLFVVQGIALSLIGIGMAIAIGFIVNPRWRQRAVKSGVTYIGVLLAKPLLFLILGFVMAKIGAESPIKDGTDPALANGLKVLTVGLILLTVGFAPATLFMYMPLLPRGGDSVRKHSSGMGRAVLAGAAGGLMSSRMFSNSSRTRSRQAGGAGGNGNSGGAGGNGNSGGAGGNGNSGGAGGNGNSGGAGPQGKPAAPTPPSGSVSGATGSEQKPSVPSSPQGGKHTGPAPRPGLKAGLANTGKNVGRAARAGIPIAAGTAKVAAGAALKAALAAANSAAASAQSQAHDHAPRMD